MLKLKTKWFNILYETIRDLCENLGTVNLGAGLYKIRTAKTGQGKRGGRRTIVYKNKFLR